MYVRSDKAQGIRHEQVNKSTTNPSCNTRCSETTHVLQASTAHGEIADEVPDQGSELEDRGDESKEEVLTLEFTEKREVSQQEFLEEDVLPNVGSRWCVVVICR